jgi:hypothetical protein
MSKEATTKTIGNISEAKVLARLVELQYPVLTPFGDNERYDLVIEDSTGVFKRIQIKTARWNEAKGVLVIQTCSSYNHCNRGKKGYKGEVDFIMAYSPHTGKVYKLKVDDVGETEVYLRIRHDVRVNSKTRFATNYEL